MHSLEPYFPFAAALVMLAVAMAGAYLEARPLLRRRKSKRIKYARAPDLSSFRYVVIYNGRERR